jgi:glyoxylase-like metal-dependent hydrolase (beta-lactamase superfamily II)
METHPRLQQIDAGGNVYICLDDDGLTLLDSGMPRRARTVLNGVAALGYAPADVKRILVTHADIDHVGSLAALQEATGAALFAGAATRDLLVAGRQPRHLPWLAHAVSSLFFRARRLPAGAITVVAPGDRLPVLDEVEVLATPGHTLDHISFFSPSTGILLAGDALNARGDRLQCSPKNISADWQAARRSALQLLDRRPAYFACGHGPLLGADAAGAAALRAALA